jgi:hypothetical protein
MAKLCRACQKFAADRGGVCDACRRRVLKDPVAPALRPGIWKLAGLLVGLLSVTSTLIAAAVMTHQTLPWHHRLSLQAGLPSTKRPLTYQIAMVVEQVTRKVYPYSIVPGGAENLDEAKRAMDDPAIKVNYANIDLTQLRQVKLTKNLSGYVSYRWGEKIYWTSKMLTLRPGETVFTDGVHLVRGRCLNGYSAHPMLPIRQDEPSEKVLDTPAEMPVIAYSFPKLPVEAPELPPPPGELTPSVPIFPPAVPSTPGKTGPGIWFPLIPIIPPIHRHPPTGVPPPFPPPVVVVITPEPNFQWLVAGLLLALMSCHGLRRRVTRLPNSSTENLHPGGMRVVEP